MVVFVFAQQRHQFGAGGDFPDLDVLVVAAAREHQAVGREREAAHVVVVSRKKKFRRLARLAVPQANGAVFAASGEGLPVRSEDDGPDIVGVAAQRAQKPAGFDVPHADQALGAAAGQGQAIGRKSDGPNAVRMAAECSDLAAITFPIVQKVDRRRLCRVGRRSGERARYGHCHRVVRYHDGGSCCPIFSGRSLIAVRSGRYTFRQAYEIVRDALLASQAGSGVQHRGDR